MNPNAISLLHEAATAWAGAQQYGRAVLYVVATPIGNLADTTLRAVHVLGRVDAIAAEDTRVAASLLRSLGLERKPLLSLHAHNEAEHSAAVLALLARGESVALVSDAGTPAISDPGAWLVAQARGAGYTVVPVPGASSAVAAVSVAGDAGAAGHGGSRASGFRFIGFLPAKGTERQQAVQAALAEPATVLLFEAPHRIHTLLAELAAGAPTRTATVARELTKQFEQLHTAPAAELPAWLAADANRARGEFVLVLHALPPPAHCEGDGEALPAAAQHTLHVLLRELPLKQAVALAAEITSAPRNRLYAAALALKGSS